MEPKPTFNIVADSAIPFLEGVFEPDADVKYIPGECPTPTIPIVSPSKLIALREASPYNAEKTYSITPPALQPGAFLTVIPWASQ